MDRITNFVAASHQFPHNDIIIHLETATTFDILSCERIYLGAIITASIGLSMKVLNENTAKLPLVPIVQPENILGQTTVANIQASLFYGNLGAIREIIQPVQTDVFKNKDVMVIGTGEFAHLFEKKNIFTLTIPDLVLQGLLFVLRKSL
ncbi:type III pantothenate kinase [Candidatus Coxiella mudrowiae]|uniref:type III pantothenate kinase n=1 Tax=Candidatus Coxiella mudrowiae TaxID=2054173 RepID=UPI0012FE7FF1|nr:type III pantothenate kinase [Candidatus Coxiella mudrowiae]